MMMMILGTWRFNCWIKELGHHRPENRQRLTYSYLARQPARTERDIVMPQQRFVHLVSCHLALKKKVQKKTGLDSLLFRGWQRLKGCIVLFAKLQIEEKEANRFHTEVSLPADRSRAHKSRMTDALSASPHASNFFNKTL